MGTAYVRLSPEEGQPGSSNYPQYLKNDGTNFSDGVLAYDASTAEAWTWKKSIPAFSSSPVLSIRWSAASATSNDVKWNVCIACITPDSDNGSVLTKSFATVNTATDTHLGTNAGREMTIDVTLTNFDSGAAGDTVWIKIERDAAAGGDTMTGDAYLEEAILTYTST